MKGTLPFLDVELKLNQNGIETWVYRKKTDTATILDFQSVAPMSWKVGLFGCLLHRAKSICSNKSRLMVEINFLKNLFSKNGYPEWWIKRTMVKCSNPRDKDEVDAEVDSIVLRLPFLGRCSSKLGMTLRNLLSAKFDVRLRVVYNSFKVGQYFILKDRTPWPLTSNVVYKFQCPGDRAVSYIGMTTRQLVERVVEHFDPKRQSAVQDHVANCKNCSDSREPLSMFSILQQCRSNRDTAITEAILIYKYNPVLNKQLGKYRGCSFNVNVFS